MQSRGKYQSMFMDEFHMWNAPTELQETNMFVHFFQILNFKKYNVLNLLLKKNQNANANNYWLCKNWFVLFRKRTISQTRTRGYKGIVLLCEPGYRSIQCIHIKANDKWKQHNITIQTSLGRLNEFIDIVREYHKLTDHWK